MIQSKLIIFTAVEIEMRAVRKAMQGADPSRFELHTVGIRAGHLPSDLSTDNVSAIVMAGLGGALDPILKIGDVVLDDPSNLVPATVPIRRGRIHTADQIIAMPKEKAELFAQTRAAAVDMENEIVSQYARQHSLPFIGVRAVGDTAAETLDPSVVDLVDDLGNPKPLAIASLLLWKPWMIAYLRNLEKCSNLAAEELGRAVRIIFDAVMATAFRVNLDRAI